ncbi:hypothetical protein RM549_04490 [Salegentibacter sp. F188]|uniref:PEGA domain-containing protein n=1 Tax=Autumnicola patrickiae TaxID=3075591 RepID=A0ABU3DZ61_9FLAO|nr:hypothetical protein [Salegentibacter sp. F188]MDT0689030.1 hypothetical protein [Salegentibacter sp. F188]
MDPQLIKSSLKIKRNSEWANKFRSFKLVLDGEILGYIEDREVKEFKISPGKHTLKAKLGWCGSKPVIFEVMEGEEKLVEVKGFIFSSWFLPVALLNGILYFYLEVVYDISSIILAFLMFFFLGYLLYFITFGRNHYLRLIEYN